MLAVAETASPSKKKTGSEMMEFHPLSTLFPAVEGAEFQAMVDDIKVNGLRQAITLFKGQILDGRTRYLACKAALVEPRFETYLGDDPVRYVVSLNVARRHMDESQRAMVAAKIAKMRQGARTDLSPIGEKSQAEAADLLNVGKRSVERATEIMEHGVPQLRDAVERGEASVSAASEIAQRPHAEQTQIVARGRAEIIRMAQVFRDEDMRIKREQRALLEVELGQSQRRKREERDQTRPPWEFVPWDGEQRLIETYDDFVDVMIASRKALGMSQADLDAATGWPDSYTSKLESWQGPEGRVAGAMSMPLWWRALGIRMLPVAVDR